MINNKQYIDSLSFICRYCLILAHYVTCLLLNHYVFTNERRNLTEVKREAATGEDNLH